jgi:hypothetical protein
MVQGEELFAMLAPRIGTGRIRRGLEMDIKAARRDEGGLQHAGVASLRSMADQLDLLERGLRLNPKPYDRIPLAQLQRQFDETYDRVFRGDAAGDPLAAALQQWSAAEARQHAEDSGPAD